MNQRFSFMGEQSEMKSKKNRTSRCGGLDFSGNMPKICVPIVESGLPALIHEIRGAQDLPIDLLEWRMDQYFGDPLNALPEIKKEAKDLPLLCTLRSKGEGGNQAGTPDQLAETLEKVIESGLCDLIDIELSLGEKLIGELVLAAGYRQIGTVLSKHDFQKTPAKGEMMADFWAMHRLGADLCKYAVMPGSPKDLIQLLDASVTARAEIGPVIAIAMGELGKITRVSGSYFGSCMTFSIGSRASAPGQIPAEEMRAVLQDLYPRL